MENATENNNREPQITFTDATIEQPPENPKLNGVWKLLKKSWSLYFSNFFTLLVIMLVPVAFLYLQNLLTYLGITSSTLSQSIGFSILRVLFWIIYLYFSTISISAIIFSVKDRSRTKDVYYNAIRNSIPFIILFLFLTLVVVGGFILLIIPGIIFAVWFSLSLYVSVFENRKWMDAMLRSKQLVAGNFWKVLWRIFIFLPIFSILIIIPFALIETFLIKYAFITQLFVSFFITPITIIFGALLYQNLADIKSGINFENLAKPKKFIYYFTGIVGLPVFIGVSLLPFLNLISWDSVIPDDSNLRLSALNIPQEQNAYYKFLQAKDLVYYPKDKDAVLLKIVNGENWDSSLADEIGQKNQQAFVILDQGLALPVFQQPEFQNPANYDMTQVLQSLVFLRDLARANSIYSLSLMKQGNDSQAFTQSLKTVKLGQMIQDGRSSLINYLIGTAIKEVGLNNLRLLTKDTHLSSADLLTYKQELDKYKESKNALQNAWRVEYLALTKTKQDSIDPVFRGEKPADELSQSFAELQEGTNQMERYLFFSKGNNFYYKPNKTQACFRDRYASLVQSTGQDNFSKVVHMERSFPWNWTMIYRENMAGTILCDIVGVSLDSAIAKKFQENFSVRTTQTIMALKAYKIDNGTLPESLDKLVPNYIANMPLDPFDGKPTRYSAEKKIIYSVGNNLTDDGGSSSGISWQSGDDLVLKIEF